MKTLQKNLRKTLSREEFIEKFYNKSKSDGSKSVLVAVLKRFDDFCTEVLLKLIQIILPNSSFLLLHYNDQAYYAKSIIFILLELSFGKITVVDLVLDDTMSDVVQKLNDLTNSDITPSLQQSASFFGGGSTRYSIWDFKTPKELDFFEKISLKLISYGAGHLPSMIQFEGLLSKKLLLI